jgi:peptidoglycan/LPS O-acetylase OafA/YrhL
MVAEEGRGARLSHVPALDGLRGLALIGVLLFHANATLRGGFLGVDLFFVLSGFLITSLLLAEHASTGGIALSSFWVRRARRLFPALLSLMPAIAAYAAFIAKPSELAGLRGDALATLGYVANWRAILSHKSYWELFTSPSPLEHTWSLSIEEQFYVVWPLVVVATLRKGSPRTVRLVALGLALVGMGITLALFQPGHTTRVYMGTDTRMVGILLGAALATVAPPGTLLSPKAVRSFDALGFIALVLLGAAWGWMTGDKSLLYHGGLWVTELAALVLIVCATQKGLVARVLSLRPLRFVGMVSYGVYLWHWPVDVTLTRERVHVHGFLLHAFQLAVTFGIAWVSFRYFERPILTRGLPFGRPIHVVPVAVLVSVLLVVHGTRARSEIPPREALLPPISRALEPDAPEYRILLVGDSTAGSLSWALRGARASGVAIEQHNMDGCTMLADTCGGESWAKLTEEIRPDATLVMLGGAFMHGITFEGEWQKSCHAEWDRRFEDNVTKRLMDLTSERGQVWACTIPYGLEAWDSADLRHEVECINRSIRRAVARVPSALVLDIGEHVCPGGVCQVESNGKTIRPDGVHYSVDGANELAWWILRTLREPHS